MTGHSLPLKLLRDGFGERGLPHLNIAETWRATRALGPGLRSVVWVQGCPFHCDACISPEWIPDRPANLVEPEELAFWLLEEESTEGLTISGGEPMMQAAGLAGLVRLLRSRRPMNLICYTGFLYEHLAACLPGSGIWQLLAQVDVLIDGPYLPRFNDNRGLRGSSNQRIHFLTGKLAGHDFESQPRQMELHVGGGYAFLVGIPPQGVTESLKSHLAKQQAAKHEEME
jgi:anaerobic ribonucleoside-triphosphate reductase activating protein